MTTKQTFIILYSSFLILPASLCLYAKYNAFIRNKLPNSQQTNNQQRIGLGQQVCLGVYVGVCDCMIYEMKVLFLRPKQGRSKDSAQQ